MLFEQNIASNVTRNAEAQARPSTPAYARARPSTLNIYWEHMETF